MNHCLLGVHPATHSYSIVKYFNFYKTNLPAVLGCDVGAFSPGTRTCPQDGVIPRQPRSEVLLETYAAWPVTLRSLRSENFHIIDQGLMWYSRFLNGGHLLGTVHDLTAYMVSSGKLPFATARPRQKMFVRENIKWLLKLDHIVSVSEFTADCLMREFRIPARRITVVPNHIDIRFQPVRETSRSILRAKWFGSAAHALIHVGKPLVYKNRLGAIKAFTLLRKRLPDCRLFLVSGSCTEEERKFIHSELPASAVQFIPPVTVEELVEIYGAADALVFPSFYEGFGWPPLEAMACGCPVVSTDCASLREVVGDAALTLEEPNAHGRIANLLFKVLTDWRLAAELRCKGLARAKLFSEQKALRGMADVYRNLL